MKTTLRLVDDRSRAKGKRATLHVSSIKTVGDLFRPQLLSLLADANPMPIRVTSERHQEVGNMARHIASCAKEIFLF
jgi:hypothetical protein